MPPALPSFPAPDASPPRAAPLWTVAVAALILLLGLAAWSNSLDGALILDDFPWIVENEALQPPRSLRALLLNPRPLLTLTLAANYALAGTAAFDYHLFNLAVHLLAAWTLFALLRRTLRRPALPPEIAARADALALLCALLWLVHPLQTQSVTYIVQRSESMTGLLMLTTLLLAARSFDGGGAGARALAVAACALGMLSKPSMIVAPVLVWFYDGVFYAGSFREALRRRKSFYAALAATAAIPVALLLAFPDAERSAGLANPLFTPAQYALTQCGVILHYLRLAFWPSGLCLAHDWPAARALPDVLLPGLILIALLALTAWALIRRTALGFAGAAFFLLLAPTSSLAPIADPCAEHRMYLPLAAVIAAVVGGGWLLFQRLCGQAPSPGGAPRLRPRPCALTALAFLLATLGTLTALTRARNAEYHSEVGMWESALRRYPRSVFIRNNLSAAILRAAERGDAPTRVCALFAAEATLRDALRMNPSSPLTRYNLGTLYAFMGRWAEAVAEFRVAAESSPTLWLANLNLAVALERAGETEDANRQYDEALRKMPKDARQRSSALVWSAENCVRLGRPAEAVERLRRALALRETPFVLNRLAWLLAATPDPAFRDTDEALRLAERARGIAGPGDVPALRTLARVLAESGRHGDAARAAEEALRLAGAGASASLLTALESEAAAYRNGHLPAPLTAPPTRSPASAPAESARPADSR